MIPILVFIVRILMAIALYSFLVWAMVSLWRDLKFHSHFLSQQKIPQLTITVDGDPLSERYTFNQNEVIIGREESCDLHLSDAMISSKHVKLTYRNMHWWVEDLMSTNGTNLNDERVESPAILINGDELRIGKTILLVEIQQLN